MLIKKKNSLKKSSVKRSNSSSSKKRIPIVAIADILPRESVIWREIMNAFFFVAEIHAFYFMETSIFEKKTFFSSYEKEFEKNNTNDIFFPLAKDGMVMRPEATIPLLRAYGEHRLGHFSLPLKAFHFTQVARYEPEHNRLVFHEGGFHIFGDTEPFYDIQVISAGLDLLKQLKIKDPIIRVNANGCRVCRNNYKEKLKRFINLHQSDFKKEELKKLEKKPEIIFSFLKSREELLEQVPTILDYLCINCNTHFKILLELLEDNGISYEPDPYFLLPVERWNRVVFEILAKRKNGERVCFFRGGRYDHLAEQILSRQIPGVGIVGIIEEFIRFIREEAISFNTRQKNKVFFIVVGDKAKKVSVRLMNVLRSSGIIVEEALGKQSFNDQLKTAEKSRSSYVLIVGQKEAFEETVIIRNIQSGAQETITTQNLSEEVRRRLKS